MAKVCEKCGKRPSMGHKVSHSNIKTLRRFNPNLQKKRLFDPETGKMVKQKLCTGCLRTAMKTTA
jgi:large subunit ribosomal protein L28